MKYEVPEGLLHWADEIDLAVTICDADCRILYMNDRSRATFAHHGDIIGHDLLQYHPAHAREKILRMLAEGIDNAYTITKGGMKKLIFQTPWRRDGVVAGLVELSMVLPENMPHFDRDAR